MIKILHSRWFVVPLWVAFLGWMAFWAGWIAFALWWAWKGA